MKLSTRARYGLKALIDLGLHSANEAISLQSIAERQDISTSYLEQLMAMLKKAGLVKSSRGAYGGYQLGKPIHYSLTTVRCDRVTYVVSTNDSTVMDEKIKSN